MTKSNYNTIIEAISDLQVRGFSLDFSLIGNKLLCAQEQCYFEAEEFDVLEIYCFHVGGLTRDETIVYAIESLSRPLKGILLNSVNQIPMHVPSILKTNSTSGLEKWISRGFAGRNAFFQDRIDI
jgi:hypothetical protein